MEHLNESMTACKTEIVQSYEQTTPQEQTLDTSRPVSDLDLSTRARKCLARLSITSIAELVKHSPDELLATKNFGSTSLNELTNQLRKMGLSLRTAQTAPIVNSGFTALQDEIMRLLRGGVQHDEIASQLGVSVAVVKAQITRITNKTLKNLGLISGIKYHRVLDAIAVIKAVASLKADVPAAFVIGGDQFDWI